MLTVEEFNNLEIGEAEVNEKIDKDKRKHVEITLSNYDLDKYLVADHYKLLKGFEWVKKLIYLTPTRSHRWDEKKYKIIPMFKQPVEFCLLNSKDEGTFRLYPLDPKYAVNAKGVLYNLNNKRFIGYRTSLAYMSYPAYGEMIKGLLVHRVVALTWIPNDDYVKKYIVDHIDENKLNFQKDNLRWITIHKNNARSSYAYENAVDNRWLVKDVTNGKVYSFDSYYKLGTFLNINYRTLEFRKPPYFIKTENSLFIVEDKLNFANWSLMKKINEYGYRYKVINLSNKQIRLFKSVEEIYKHFNTSEYKVKGGYKGNAIEKLKEYLIKKGYILKPIGEHKIYNQNTTDKYKIEAKDLETGEVIVTNSTREMIVALGGKPNNKGIIIIRLNGNKREGLPLEINGKRYLIRRNDKPWPMLKESKKPKQKKIKVLTTEGIKYFNSLREAERHLPYGRTTLSKLAKDTGEELVINLIR